MIQVWTETTLALGLWPPTPVMKDSYWLGKLTEVVLIFPVVTPQSSMELHQLVNVSVSAVVYLLFDINLTHNVAIECLEPTSPENGHVEYDPESQKPPYVAYYRCNEGFQLKGDENRTCSGVSADNSGEFTGEDPTCEGIISTSYPTVPRLGN